MKLQMASWTHTNNLHAETVKYSINKNDVSLILNTITICTYWFLVLGKFFRRSTDQKHHVNMKQNVEINSAATSRGQGKYLAYAWGNTANFQC
jgi:hypothetical protein